jgi:hypothetical protein
MRRDRCGFIGVLGVALWTAATVLGVQEEKITLAKVPARVMSAANRAVPRVKWTEATKEIDEGETIYGLSGKDASGREVAVNVTAEGKVVEIDTEIALTDVPQVVMSACRNKYPKFKPDGAMSIREEGKLTGYSLDGTMIGKDGVEVTIYVSADGKEVELEEDQP